MYMNKEYNQALEKIQKLNRKVSVKEWNKIAKQENLLSSKSLRFLSKRDFYALSTEVRKEASK